MSGSERLVLLAFVSVVVIVFYAAAHLAAVGIYRRVRGKKPAKISPVKRWLARAVWSLAGLGALCIGYAYFVEPYWLDVTHVTIVSDKLPPSAGPLRIVHISDLQCDAKVRLEEKLPQVIANLQPDLIAFTGDAINSRAGLDNFRRCMDMLSRVAPTFAVKGNWDTQFHQGFDLYEGTGVKELAGNVVELEKGDTKVRIAGIAVGKEYMLPAALSQLNGETLNIFLYHMPGLIYEIAAGDVDLALSGHTHGGQVALPFYGAVVTLARYGKRFESGLYRVEDTQMYVNRGIGMEGSHAPRVRFFARPEVTLIEIVPKPKSADVP